MTPERQERIKNTSANRQQDVTLVLENVHDPHNIGAVLRTCDSVGIHEVVILYTQEELMNRGIQIGVNSSSGARRWLDIHYFTDLQKCVKFLHTRNHKIYTTAIGESAKSIYNTNFLEPCALVFGNEHSGVSMEMMSNADANILIPQVGMVKSLNISVACAVTLYEVFRQRMVNGKYSSDHFLDEHQQALFKIYAKRHEDRIKNPAFIDHR